MVSRLNEWQEKDFNTFLKSKSLALVEFGAPWCSACKITEPILMEISQHYPEIIFSKINVAKNPGLASRMGVMSLPNILFLNGGHVKDQIIGAATKTKIEEKIKKIVK